MKITKEIKLKVTRPGTVGQMEMLAGLAQDHESRFDFWRKCDADARERFGVGWVTGEQVCIVARERCHAKTLARIRSDKLCMI